MKSFKSDIKETVSKLNKNNSSVASYIQTRSGQDVLRISKNGTRYLFSDNMSFTAPTKQPIIKPKEKLSMNSKQAVKVKQSSQTLTKIHPLVISFQVIMNCQLRKPHRMERLMVI